MEVAARAAKMERMLAIVQSMGEIEANSGLVQVFDRLAAGSSGFLCHRERP